jgi:uncharacterized protein YaeQ
MAQKSTIFKANLNVADMDRQFYGDFPLTVARHPSETDERMMLRLLVFALHANEQLEFGKGISTDEEPDLWQKSLSGEIDLWIELGTPDPDRIRKACGRAKEVLLYCYGRRAVPVWWEKHAKVLRKSGNLKVYEIPADNCEQLAAMAQTSMDLQCSITDGEAWFSCGDESTGVRPVPLLD